jgi:hypothetical protein
MSGKYGSASITISFDDAPGGTLRDMTQYILTMSGIKREAITQQTNPFGTSAEASTPTGMIKVPDITVTGIFDTTASTGPHVVFGTPDTSPQAATRTLTVVFGDGKTATMESRLVSYEVIGKDGNLTEYSAVIRQAGDLVWS